MSRRAESRDITQKDKEALVKPVTDGLADLVFGSPGLFQDRPGFIAQPQGENPFVNAVRGLTQLNCRVWAAADKDNYSTRVNAGNSALCGPYLDGLGEKPDDGAIGPPFEGGQCATGYLFVISAETGPQPGSSVNANSWVTGPIVSWRSSRGENSTTLFVTANSGPRALANCNSPSVGGIQERVWAVVSNAERGPFTARIDNQCPAATPSCGNPPPQIRPPSRVTPGTPIPPVTPIDLPGFGPVGVTVGFDGDGNIEVCVPELDFCVSVGGEPAAEPEPGGGEPAPSNGPNENGPGDPGAVGDGGGAGDDGDFGEPPEGRAWVGAFVEFTVPSKLGNIPSANPANPAYATVIGNVCLDHDGVFSDAKQVRSKWVSCFRDNPNLTVKGTRVNTKPGVGFKVYPVSAEICPENTCAPKEPETNG